jgi:hypothetical protein
VWTFGREQVIGHRVVDGLDAQVMTTPGCGATSGFGQHAPTGAHIEADPVGVRVLIQHDLSAHTGLGFGKIDLT